MVIDAGTFDLTEAPLTFRYFALSLATRELDLTMQPIDLRYFKADLVTLAVTVTGNPVTFELA